MKELKSAVRRHHERRLKKKRGQYKSLNLNSGAQWIGRQFQTPCDCSCWMCGNQRKYHGLTFQELKALEQATQDMGEFI